MTVQRLTDLKTPIGEILRAAGEEGLLLEPAGQPRFAVIPLDDDLIDFLLERNTKLAEDCKHIRKQMQEGKFLTHEQVKGLLATEGQDKGK